MAQEISTKFFDGLYEAPTYTLSPSGTETRYAVPEGDGIYEDSKNKLIFFPVAGYTKAVSPSVDMKAARWNGINRQQVIKELMYAVHLQPLVNSPGRNVCASEAISIKLIPEPTNQFDKDAILIMALCADGQYYPIGYVPSKINKIILAKGKWFKDEDLMLIFKLDAKGKHIIPQLCVGYENPEPEKHRFQNIEYE